MEVKTKSKVKVKTTIFKMQTPCFQQDYNYYVHCECTSSKSLKAQLIPIL